MCADTLRLERFSISESMQWMQLFENQTQCVVVSIFDEMVRQAVGEEPVGPLSSFYLASLYDLLSLSMKKMIQRLRLACPS